MSADERVTAVGEAPSDATHLAKVLHALSDPVRLGIVMQLHRQGERSCAALDGGRSKSTMSHHFRVLREAGVVETRVHGVTHMNALRREHLEATFPGLLDAIIAAAAGQPEHLVQPAHPSSAIW